MDLNIYVLERQVEMKLAEARASSAREALVSSLRADRRRPSSVLVAPAVRRVARWLRRRAIRGRSGGLPTPSAL